MNDRSTIFDNGNLAAGFIVNRLLDKAQRVHVLDLAARAKVRKVLAGLIFFILAGAADRYVHIGAQIAVLHIAITSPQIAQDLAQFGDIGCGLFGAANVGAADDFHQGHASAVEIDKRHGRIHIMDRLARVLFQMNTLDAHQAGHAGRHFHQNLTLAHDGVVQLADLVALRQVGVEIILAVKGRAQVDRGL